MRKPIEKPGIKYPRLWEIQCLVYEDPVDHVRWSELEAATEKYGLDREKFAEYYGVQTCCEVGPYAWDVEAVLERMLGHRLTGTQLHWD